jgi:phytoene desaturase
MSAAVHLAARGHDVTLLERTERLGGKAGLHEEAGFSFDTGPSLVTMPEVLDELWNAAGADRERDLQLIRLDPQCRYFFPDGRSLDLHNDAAQSARSVAAYAPGEALSFGRVLARSGEMHEELGRRFLERPHEGIFSLARSFSGSPLRALRLALFGGNLRGLSERLLHDEGLRAIVQRYATYVGGDPQRTPAVYGTILHIESAAGCWYPAGGIHAIVRGISRLLEHLDVHVELRTAVEQVRGQGKTWEVSAGGERRVFDLVVVNADPVTTARKLLDPATLSRSGLARYTTGELAMSGAVLLLGIEGEPDGLAHHNVLFPADYAREFTDIFRHRRPPAAPTVYVCVPSLTDPARAPRGCHSLFCMVNAPALREGSEDDGSAETIERIKDAIARFVPGLAGRVRVERFIGPAELQRRYDAPGGSIYGLSPHGRLAPLHRPAQRVAGVRGLYFVGGGAHPGGGIPLVLRSGRFAAELAGRDFPADRHRKAAA